MGIVMLNPGLQFYNSCTNSSCTYHSWSFDRIINRRFINICMVCVITKHSSNCRQCFSFERLSLIQVICHSNLGQVGALPNTVQAATIQIFTHKTHIHSPNKRHFDGAKIREYLSFNPELVRSIVGMAVLKLLAEVSHNVTRPCLSAQRDPPLAS